MTLPRYPIYVPTKGRYKTPLTIRFLLRDRVPFYAVVEESERDAYAEVAGAERLLVLPESGQGLRYARNWIKAHATAAGAERHWQIDDNIGQIRRAYRGRRIPCEAGPALAAVEDFADRYENVAIAGLTYQMFGFRQNPPFFRNVHVYSCTLVDNSIPFGWRLVYNDDTDLCLQVLAAGLCTVLVNVFTVAKMPTMTIRGGNTDDLYQGDGRLVMARSLERVWPGVVKVARRYGRPQHVVDWTRFDTPLKLREGVDLGALTENEYGLALTERSPVESEALREVAAAYRATRGSS